MSCPLQCYTYVTHIPTYNFKFPMVVENMLVLTNFPYQPNQPTYYPTLNVYTIQHPNVSITYFNLNKHQSTFTNVYIVARASYARHLDSV